MKTMVSIATLVWLSCALLLAQNSTSSPTTPQTDSSGSKQGLRCLEANPAVGYTSPKLPNSKRDINLYNIDFSPKPPKDIDPVCLSRQNGTILWASGTGKRFKVRVHLKPNQDPQCGQHPFLKEPPSDTVDGYFSGAVRPDVPFYCVYEIEFQEEDGHTSDPHIQTTPP